MQSPAFFGFSDFASAQESAVSQEASLAELDERIAKAETASHMSDPNALKMAEEAEAFALALAPSPRQTERLVTAIRLQAREQFGSLNYEEARKHIIRAKEYPLDNGSVVYGELMLVEGQIFRGMGDFGAAVENYHSALKLFVSAERDDLQATAMNALGNAYNYARQYERGYSFFQRALTKVEESDKIRRHRLLNNIAISLANFERFGEAEAAYRDALAVARDIGHKDAERATLGNLAYLEIRRGNHQSAQEYLDRAFSLAEEHGLSLRTSRAFSAELSLRTGDLEKSQEMIEALFAGKDLSSTYHLYVFAHETAFKLYEQLGETNLALLHLKSFKRLDDIAKKLATDASRSILDAEYQFAQNELEIERLRAGQLESDAALAAASRRQRELMSVGLAILALGAIGFFFWRYKIARRTQRITEALNDELAAKNSELALSNVRLEKANHAKMEFLATTSHEVRTPLNAIIGLTDVILAADEFSQSDRENLEVVNTSGKNLLLLLDDILDISKLEAGRIKVNLQPLDIAECVLEVAGLWRNSADEKGLELNVDVDEVSGNYMCDERLIRQVVSNLVSNAIKFTDKGEVTVCLRAPVDEGFAISVRDTGIGVAPDQQETVFETFRQAQSGDDRNYGGVGLGLAICKKITEALGGDISVVSAPGEGATFTVKVPAEKCETAMGKVEMSIDQNSEEKSPEAENERGLSVLRILVAEDNPANALVISAMLSGQVAQIEVVENGAEAVKAIQERSYDVILMDKQMPEMDGAKATREIRALPMPYCNIPIVGLTAHILADSKKECLESGMDDYLTKPVPSARLKKAILDAVKTRRAAAA